MPVALSLWLVVTGSSSYRKLTQLFFKISLLCKARDLSLSPQPVAGLPKRLFAPRSSVPGNRGASQLLSQGRPVSRLVLGDI